MAKINVVVKVIIVWGSLVSTVYYYLVEVIMSYFVMMVERNYFDLLVSMEAMLAKVCMFKIKR